MAWLLVEGGTVITMGSPRRIIKEGALLIDGDRIKAVGKAAKLKASYPGADVLDAREKLILPGLIDTHIHLGQMLARGLTDDIDGKLVRWSWDRVYPWEARLSEEDIYASARLCCLEMIRTGTTTFADPGGRYMDPAIHFAELARVLKDTLFCLYRALDDPAFNYTIDTSTTADEDDPYYHWHIRIVPRITMIAGFEIGSGIYINTALPEETTKIMRSCASSMPGDECPSLRQKTK